MRERTGVHRRGTTWSFDGTDHGRGAARRPDWIRMRGSEAIGLRSPDAHLAVALSGADIEDETRGAGGLVVSRAGARGDESVRWGGSIHVEERRGREGTAEGAVAASGARSRLSFPHARYRGHGIFRNGIGRLRDWRRGTRAVRARSGQRVQGRVRKAAGWRFSARGPRWRGS